MPKWIELYTPGDSKVLVLARAYRDQAGASAIAAGNAATAAAGSATTAGNAATAAGGSATTAGNAATAAVGSATMAGNAATAAAGSATTAGNAATAAGDAATAAGGSAGAAAADRASATASASSAAASRAAVEAAVAGASLGQPVIPLIGTADFHSGLTFARASTATLQQPFAAPTTLTEFAANAPRWDAQFGLRMEAAATALDANPRLEGAIAGNPGTVPSGLMVFNSGSVARQIVGAGTEGGYHYLDVQHTLTNTNNLTNLIEYAVAATGAAGLSYSGACAVKLISGTPPAMSVVMFDSTTAGTAASFTPSASYQFLTPAPQVASGGSPLPRIRLRNGTGVFTGVFVLRYIFFNIVQSTIRSSLILPPVGVPGSTTRARDVLSGALSGLSLATPGLTIVGRAMVPFTPESGAVAAILQIDNNAADANALRIGTAAGSASIIGSGLTTAGGAVNTASLGSFTPGTEFAWGLSYNRLTGGAIFNVGGGTSLVIPDGAAPLQAIATHLRFGGLVTAGSGLNGFLRRSVARPFVVSATDLAALVAAA